jgi:hypothetical protein
VVICPGAPPVVEIFGEIDIQSAPQLREELLRVVRRHGSRLALASALVVGAHPSVAERAGCRIARLEPGGHLVPLLLGIVALGELDIDRWHDVPLCKRAIPRRQGRVAHARTCAAEPVLR